MTIRERWLGPHHPALATALNTLALLHDDQGELAKAEPLFLRALRIREQAHGPHHSKVATVVNNLGALYHRRGDYARAEPMFRRALTISEAVDGPDHSSVATALNNLASVLQAKGDYGGAEPLFERALAIDERTRGPHHPDVATSLNNLALLYRDQGRHRRAEPLFRRALRISERAFGKTHPAVATTVANLGLLYQSTGQYGRSKVELERALHIWQTALGRDHPHSAVALGFVAELYRSMGQLRRALSLAERSAASLRKTLGSTHPRVAAATHTLAELYHELGDYPRAETLFLEALRQREQLYGAVHPHVAHSLEGLASLYRAKGELGRAEGLVRRSLQIRRKLLGAAHPDVAHSLSSLASLYSDRRMLAKAEPLYAQATAILEGAHGADHPTVATALHNQAGLYEQLGDIRRAEQLFAKALAIKKRKLGPQHPSVARTLNDLAALRHGQGDTKRAIQLTQQALAIAERTYGPDGPLVSTMLTNLATLHEAAGDVAQAVQLQARATEARERDLAAILSMGTETQKRAYLVRLRGETNATLSLHLGAAPTLPEAGRLALTTLLRRKGRVLDASADTLHVLRQQADRQTQAELDGLATTRAELATRLLRGPLPEERGPDHQAALARLRTRAHGLERSLGTRYAALRAAGKPVTIEAVQAALPDHAALVELAAYRPFDPSGQAKLNRYGDHRYAAYVLARRGPPRWVDLGPAAPIEQQVARLRAGLADQDPAYLEAARALDQQVFRPVRALLGEVRDVLLSPDGMLQLVPFAALVDEQGRFVVSRYRFTYLTSGRDLLRMGSAPSTDGGGDLLIADPSFGEPPSEAPPMAPPGDGTTTRRGTTGLDKVRFLPLPGTAAEAEALRTMLAGARLLRGSTATEAALKGAARPRILHVATHGFFLEDRRIPSAGRGRRALVLESDPQPGGPRGVLPHNPLLRSGIALAGANQRRRQGDDGIVTALEMAHVDLHGTKLVVLSACETALGEVRNGESIYGLRRALVLAGSETQVMSLWKVDDEATRALMVGYYQRLQQGMGRSQAMRQTQLAMLENPETAHPFFWASFIVSGDGRSLSGKAPAPVASSEIGSDAASLLQAVPGSRGCTCLLPARPGEGRHAGWALSLLAGMALLGRTRRRRTA